MKKNDKQPAYVIAKAIELLIHGDINNCKKTLDDSRELLKEHIDWKQVSEKIYTLIEEFREGVKYITTLSDGDLEYEAPHHFHLFSHYKQLQANLRHLTWQTQQIAEGDYSQKVSFMGDFSVAFNKLIEGLREKKRIQEQLAEMYISRDRIMSIISHDLKSPFTAILGLSDILQHDWQDLTEDEKIQSVSHIQYVAQNTFKLLENLLDWSRIQTNKINFSPEIQKISTLVDEMIILLKPSAQNKHISLSSEIPVETTAWADKYAMQTVVRNLISNAIKFTQEGGNVKVKSREIPGFIEVVVEDTGVGIPPENFEKLFKLGENIKTSGTHQESGTGLGLLLCKEFVGKNGGTIQVESKDGIGSRFIFTLPVNDGEEKHHINE